MKKEEKANFTTILRTGKSYEIEMAANILKEKGIPFIRQEGSTGGIITAMPMTPTPGPGVWWAILVPEVAFKDAKTILSELPMELQAHPDIWDYGASEKTKKGWKIYAVIMLAMLALWMIGIISEILSK